MSSPPKRSDLVSLYGEITEGHWPDESKHMVMVYIPDELVRDLRRRMYCNIDMAFALRRALQTIVDRGLAAQVKTWDGCFEIRATRGEERLSVHSWGLAVDLNAATNKLGTEGDMSPELAACFTEQGFIWGKTFHRQDPMHMSYCLENQ